MPGRSARNPPVGQGGQVGEAGHQAVDQGARAVAGARVDDQAGRFVDHDDVVVGVDHGELHRRVGLRLRGRGLVGPVDVEGLVPARRVLRLATDRPVHRTRPAATRASTEERDTSASRATARSTRTPSSEAGTTTDSVAHDGPAPDSDTARRMQPTVMQASATLNVGQKWKSTKSTTRTVVAPEEPVGQIAERPAEDEARTAARPSVGARHTRTSRTATRARATTTMTACHPGTG